MLKKRVSVRDEARKKTFQVAKHIPVGIFCDEQRSTGVVDEQVAQAAASVREAILDRSADFIQAATAGLQLNGFIDYFWHGS